MSDAAMLPAGVRPSRYELMLAPNLDDFTFRGDETVEIEVLEPTSEITLNCAELQIQSCRLTGADGSALVPVEARFDESDETVTFTFEGPLPVGSARLALEFTGELNEKLRGLYRSHYTDQDGAERYIATTQFEATDARRAFPCWDEPALKATFQVTLLVPAGLAAVSNMPIVSETDAGPGLSRKEFAETPPMSTYLLAFVIGDLRSIEKCADDGTLIRVWATGGKEEQGHFALDISAKMLAYFNDYFGIPYPLDKLDHIAIPDFAAGAMENWGAITYREPAVLVDPENSSAATRQSVAGIVAHEMAHMWFGDLVTMSWWNDLWLNESFASWMGDKAVDHLLPEWDVWTQFVSHETNRALSLDGLQSSHPIEQEVKNPDEIGQLFDAISYSKGGSVLRMLERFLGAEAFRDGLRRYIARHQYGNARTRDLWAALGEASGQPVEAMMDTWVKQTGYPVLDVETKRNEQGTAVSATQRRFVYEHLIAPESSDDSLWDVPLSAKSSESSEPGSMMMDRRRAAMSLPTTLKETEQTEYRWTKVNPEQTGFYRVNYSAGDWGRLRPAIEGMLLSPVDRLGVQNDAYALSRAGYLQVTQFLALADAYVNEMDASVWADLAANFGSLDSLLAGEPYYPRFQASARRLFGPVAGRVGWDAKPSEGHLDVLLRSTVLTQLGRYGDEGTLGKARGLFDRYASDQGSVRADIRTVVFTLTARGGDRAVYDPMWDLRKSATLEEEKTRLLAALTNFEDPALVDETLARSLTSDVRFHETVAVVAGVASSRTGLDRAWEFAKANWEEFDRRYGEGGFGLMRLVGITSRFSTQDRLDDVRGFFEAHPVPAADRTVRQSLEAIRLNIAWLDKNREDLAEWFGG